jgi:hypothetical protein
MAKFGTQLPFSTVPKVVDLTADPREERIVAAPYNLGAIAGDEDPR